MSAALRTSEVEQDQLRELLAMDRRMNGQLRQQRCSAPLTTVAYQKPLSVRLRRRFQRDRALRVRVAGLGLGLVLALGGLSLWFVRGVEIALPTAWSQRQIVLAAERAVEEPAVFIAPKDAEPSMAPIEDRPAAELPATRRLQQAQRRLRDGSKAAAREARVLLESALDELPGSVNGQAALARACLRVGDETCARTAIHKAVLARPWRTTYRELACEIDRKFAPTTRTGRKRAGNSVLGLSCDAIRKEGHTAPASQGLIPALPPT